MPKFFYACVCVLTFFAIHGASAATCTSSVAEVIVKDPTGNLLSGVKVQVYEQLFDANGQPKPGTLVGSATTDKSLGKAIIKIKVSEVKKTYILNVVNPSLKQNDFWFYNRMVLACGDTYSDTVVLSGFRIRVMDGVNLQTIDDAKLNFYSQVSDGYGEVMSGTALGSANTGSSGVATIYSPSADRSASDSPHFLLMEVKNNSGVSFWNYSLQATDGQWKEINYKLSDAVFTVRDAETSLPLPKVKLDLYEQKIDALGGLTAGKSLGSLTTNDDGKAYWQYAAGNYLAQVKYPDGRTENYKNLIIEKEKRSTFNFILDRYSQAKCSLKTEVRFNFNDADSKIVGGFSYNLYEQKLSYDGVPMADAKVLSGTVDAYGYAKKSFNPSPAKKYTLEVCDGKIKYACHWFYDITFPCVAMSVVSKNVSSVELIIRRPDKKLAVGETVKLYAKQVDADGNSVIDRSRLMASLKIPASGLLTMYLSPTNSQNEKTSYYAVMTGNKKQELSMEINPVSGEKTRLEYIQQATTLAPYQVDAPAGLRGRILLQVESRGEAWYVNPADNKRYYLGNPDQALAVMRRLSIGARRSDLNKIAVAVGLASDVSADSDSDGLSDALEKALNTNPNLADSDADGYDDYSEVSGGYSPTSDGSWGLNTKFAISQTGRILLQVDGHGEAWYVFPVNNKRYFLGRPATALAVMRELGLGITNKNLSAIPVGSF